MHRENRYAKKYTFQGWMMLFNTVSYLLFLPAVVLIYYVLPKRARYLWLLAASYYFYMQWNRRYAALLFLCTALTYGGGLVIEKQKKARLLLESCSQRDRCSLKETCARQGACALFEKQKSHATKAAKICLVFCLAFCLGILGVFKYSGFITGWANAFLARIRPGTCIAGFDFLLPVGISFYTLQALGYLIDVYRGDIYAERNFFRYALFVSFFPQLVAGPIERSKNLLVQLSECPGFDFAGFKRGILLVVYGLFLKMVAADRAAVIVDTVFTDTAAYPGFYIAAAVFFFAIQIYCDFYGYSTIARGSALLMGFNLMENFQSPYHARSVREFWRRWHISLGSWFRDYLYIPLGGSRKGFVRRELNLFFVFAVSGLWHGASMGFVFWGMLHALYQILPRLWQKGCGALAEAVRQRFPGSFQGKCAGRKEASFSVRLFQRLCTFVLVSFAWLFFRAGGFSASLQVVRAMLSVNNWTVLFDGSLYGLGVGRGAMYAMLAAIAVLLAVDRYKYRGGDAAGLVLRQGWLFQACTVLAMTAVILLYGCYGTMYDTQQFIYFQF